MTESTVAVVGKGAAVVVAYPPNYWEYSSLKLCFKDNKDCSIDQVGAKKYKAAANVPGDYVVQLQKHLAALGYLPNKAEYQDGHFGGSTARAVLRFQRHAARKYRMPQPDAADAELFKGAADGVCDSATATEIKKWIDKGWKLPLGRFAVRKLNVAGVTAPRPILRVDVADAWEKIVPMVQAKGGVLDGLYGDMMRGVHKTEKVGASRHSLHYTGRAIDICQAYGNPPDRRYYPVEEPSGGKTWWRVYCKTGRQDGSQGTEIKKRTLRATFSAGQEYIPSGYYLDLTELIQSTGEFQRIHAQANWNSAYNKREWWHFQYMADLQPTFLDEMELVGVSEADLRAAGWSSDADLDHTPG